MCFLVVKIPPIHQPLGMGWLSLHLFTPQASTISNPTLDGPWPWEFPGGFFKKSWSSPPYKPCQQFTRGAEAAVVVWILRDLSFSLVVFVLPDPLSRWFTSKGVTSVAGVPIQDGSEGSEGPSQRVFVGYESSDEL